MKPAEALKLALGPTEIDDAEWQARFWVPAMERKDFFDAHENGQLSIEELVAESDEQYDDLFLWFLGLSPERQQRVAPKLKADLEHLRALRQSNCEKARRMLEKQGLR